MSSSASNAVPDSSEHKSLRILVVDDEPLVRAILDECLKLEGHSVKPVAGAEEALAQIHSENWDVVLTDRMMPGLNGEELAAEIKRFDPLIPVVLVTGMPESDGAGNSPAVIDAFLQKPFTRQTLRDSIASAVNIRGPRQLQPQDGCSGKAA